MKLKNVHYEYRGNDTWRIYFKDFEETKEFQNERGDGKKPRCPSIFTNSLGIRHYVEAKLTGLFNILRRCVKDPANDYFSNDIWTNLVKKIEGADSDYIFDEIDLRYDATTDKCYFMICCMNGTWTESSVKYMLNSQFGMVAQANGYYDTDTAYQGGLCVRRSCCGIGFDLSTYKTDKERIMFLVKDYCSGGKTDIIKVGAWTNTFIGTNKENEKEYSWSDFKKYMGLLHANDSDIWDIEWEYDELCPMTGTEVADKLHVYLQPGAYKRVFEEKPKQLLKNITDVVSCATKVLGCGTLYYYNLYFDDKSDLKYVADKHINRSILDSVKGKYYIWVVSYNKELPKNISSATLVWDQEENRYSVDDFTIKGYRSEGNRIWLSTGTLWSNNDYLARVRALTPPPVPYWVKLDDDVAFIKDFKATQKKEANNKEEKNMGPKETSLKDLHRRLYWGYSNTVKPTKILIQGTATIIWWSDGTKTIVKCQKGDKMDPEKGIAMCVMKKFMGTNKTGSNYLDFAKPAIKDYEAKQKAMAAARKKAADKKRRAAKKEKEEDNGEA